jgi:acid phosphatase type 7
MREDEAWGRGVEGRVPRGGSRTAVTPARLRPPATFVGWILPVSVALVLLGAVWAAGARAADVVAAAGDIACDPDDSAFNGGLGTRTRCRQKYTSDLLVNAGLSRVLALGDLQYNSGSLADFRVSYDPSWGRVKSITRPVLGNHEGGGTGYFDYFNGVGVSSGPAGQRGKGYYSFNVGAWHLIALNSNCSRVPCSKGSAQEKWLRADLGANRSACTLAYWHHPRFSSGHDGDSSFMQTIWRDLYDAGADVVLSGHSHNYERFAPQNGSGKLDRARGIRQFVVGTGGAHFTGLGTPKPNSEVRQNTTFGVLKLTLNPTSYDWRFVPEAGKTFTDSGRNSCHVP